MSNLHLRSNLSALFERFHRKSTHISGAVWMPVAHTWHRLSEMTSTAWSAVHRKISGMRRR